MATATRPPLEQIETEAIRFAVIRYRGRMPAATQRCVWNSTLFKTRVKKLSSLQSGDTVHERL
jgi:hypothetical protein